MTTNTTPTQRLVRVVFDDSNGRTREENYGAFTTAEQLVEWLDEHEHTFGLYAVIEIRRLGVPVVTAVPAVKAPAKTRTRKRVTS